jgi:phosphate/phosphite/phosphonate ABC transporter binding protein
MRRACVMAAALLLAGCERQAATSDPGSAGLAVAVPEGGTERPKRLVFGLTPFLSEEQLRREYDPLAEYLGQKLGIPVELRIAGSYTELSAQLRRYEVHLAVLSPFSYVSAKRDNPDLILLATHIADGSSTYAAYIVTRERSGYQSVHDLAGKRFAFVDKSSTSGYVYPLAYLRGLSIDPDTFFGSTVFTGNHEKLVELVLEGKVDAGATYATAYTMAHDKGLRILAKTGRIPFDAYVASPRLDQQLVNDIRQLLLGLSTRSDEGRRLLGRLTNINGFVSIGDDHYDDVRRIEQLSGAAVSP